MICRGEIFWVGFDRTVGSEQSGLRPALVVQSDIANSASPTTVVAAITNKRDKKYPFHVDVYAQESGLSKDSTVLLEQLRTIDQQRLADRIGRLSESRMLEINKALKVILEID